VEFPKSIKAIDSEAFSGCGNLYIEKFPQSISLIGADAFAGCNSLYDIDLSGCSFNGNKFNFDIFKDCNLHMIRLPYGTETVTGDIENCTVFFPNTVKVINGSLDRCKLHFTSKNPPTLKRSGYENTIYVPKNCTTAYYGTWGNLNNYVEE